ncbi:transposase family protein [Streptomyces sp. NPDC012466]|uniref:transposase family protein n=1 Tax=Streptomyces sp. NPDC012466 TaxID=3364835 RepID=UPI0036EA18D3
MPGSDCPDCGSWSRRIHSSYLRFPADVPSGGRRAVLCLPVRRFLCPLRRAGDQRGLHDRHVSCSRARSSRARRWRGA